MRCKINGVEIDLTEDEERQLSEGKIPERLREFGKIEVAKVLKPDGSYVEEECAVYRIEF